MVEISSFMCTRPCNCICQWFDADHMLPKYWEGYDKNFYVFLAKGVSSILRRWERQDACLLRSNRFQWHKDSILVHQRYNDLKSKTGLPNMHPCLISHRTRDKAPTPPCLPYFKDCVSHIPSRKGILQPGANALKLLPISEFLYCTMYCARRCAVSTVQRWRLKGTRKGLHPSYPSVARIVIYVLSSRQVCV